MLSLQAVAAADNSKLWAAGNKMYLLKQYDSAAIYYEQIAQQKPRNAQVYYNLGNTYYKLNNIAKAVLNYERALQIDPSHIQSRDNLLLTQNRIPNHIQAIDDVFFVSWWQSATHASKATMWAVLALLVFLVTVPVAYLRHVRKARGTMIPAQLIGVLAFVWVCFLVLAAAAMRNASDSSLAVVMVNDAPLMGAGLRGKPLIMVPEGTSVRILSVKGEYMEVSLPDGRKGFLQSAVVNKI